VAYYPTQGYAALVEFGTAKNAPLRITEQHFTVLTEHLQRFLTTLCADGYHRTGVIDDFSMVTGGSYKTVFMYLGLGKQRKHFVFKMHELQYLSSILHIITNQLERYKETMMDVVAYSISALSSSEYIEPHPTTANIFSTPSCMKN
jgi:hypothetical protein